MLLSHDATQAFPESQLVRLWLGRVGDGEESFCVMADMASGEKVRLTQSYKRDAAIRKIREIAKKLHGPA